MTAGFPKKQSLKTFWGKVGGWVLYEVKTRKDTTKFRQETTKSKAKKQDKREKGHTIKGRLRSLLLQPLVKLSP